MIAVIGCERGVAVRLNKKRATASGALAAVDQLLHDEKAREEVLKSYHREAA